MPRRAPLSLRMARALVRAAAPLVPHELREGWVEEWEAELWHESRIEAGRPLVRKACGAFRAAWAVRREAGAWGSGSRHTRDIPREATMMGRDVGHALRSLARSPGFTLLAGLTLAIGLGATAAMFAVVDSVLLRPLPYPEADRLVMLEHPAPGQQEGAVWGLSVAGYFHFREGMESLQELGAYSVGSANLTGGGEPERLAVAATTTSLLRTLGASAALGRIYSEAEDDPGAADVVVLGHDLWVRRFGADPGIVGRTIELGGNAVPVIGVMTEQLDLPRTHVDAWVPWRLDAGAPAMNDHHVRAIGILAEGVPLATAADDMARLTRRLPERFPEAYSPGFMEEYRFGASLTSLRDVVIGDVGGALWVLLAGVALVLVIACANVANLVLVRAEARAREVAVRRAIGAGRGALRRYFLVEGVVLSLGAAAIGLGLAALAIDALTALAPPGLPRLDEVRVRPATVLLALGAAGAIGLLFGSFPVLGSSERALSRALGEGGRGRTFGARAVRIRGWLLAGQVALALVLLTASGLMVRSLSRLAAVDAGFEEEGVLTFRVGLPSADYPDADAVYRFHRGMLDRLAASGLVEAAGAIDQMPISGGDRCMLVFPEEEYLAPDRPIGCPSVRFVGAGYFEAMGIAVVEGRALERADEESRAGSIVVSRSMASRIWPDLDTPLGRGLRLWGEGFYRVVGVVEDVRDRGLDVPAAGAVYFPLRPLTGESFPPLSAVTYVVRSASGVTEGLAAEARAAVADLDPRLPIAELRTFEEIVDRSMIRTTFTLLLMSLASAMALLIGVVGIYGVVSYVVAQRRREVGVRMALGARGGQVTALVVGDVGRHAAVGLVLGVAAALPGTRLLRSLLFEVSPTDPVTLVAVPTLLAGVVLLAAWLPARRAARVDPVQALRAD